MEKFKLQSQLVPSNTDNTECRTDCVASTSNDGAVAIKEEPVSEDAYDEVVLYGKPFCENVEDNVDNDDNDDNDNDDDDDDEEANVERYQIKCIDYDEDSYNTLLLDHSTSNDASILSSNVPERDPSSDNSCSVGDMGNSSESIISHNFQNFDAELSKLLSSGADTGPNSNRTLVNAKTCLFLNNIYQAVLQENLLKLHMELIQNQEKQKALKEELNKTTVSKKLRRNVFHQPYFMNAHGMPPLNEHAKLLKPWHLKHIQRDKYWKKWEQDLLVSAVQENAWEVILKPFMNKIEIYTDKLLACKESITCGKLQLKLDQVREEMAQVEQKDINSFFSNEDFEDRLDWMKIANLTFCERHTEFSCRLMWRNWLQPGINKKPWIKVETERLKKLVELHGRHQWQRIAKELNTNRTPMHCLQHYRRELDTFTKRGWTDEEDKILKEVVDSCRIGNRVPWNQVSFYMEGRSNSACIARWTALDPTIKHGRWTQEEDSLLVAAVQIMGTSKWQHVRTLVPNRTANQCRERWVNCLDPGINSGQFTYEEDKLLLKYVRENGVGNWAAVASHLPGRTDQSCSTQYYRLKKWQDQAKFVKKQSDESKSYFMHDFDARKYADQVQSGKCLDELIPLPRPSKFQNNINNIVCKWQQENLKRDLVKQELDSRKGDIYVPRPPLLRKYSPNVTKVWDTRNKLRQSIEQFVQSQLVESGEIESKEKTDRAYTIMRSKLDQLKPNTRVSDILKIARGISLKTDKRGDCRNIKPILAIVDQQIKDLLYVRWMKDNYVNRLEPFQDEFLTQTADQKGRTKLQLLHLYVNAIGPRSNLYQKIKAKRCTITSGNSKEEAQTEDFRLMFLSSFNRELTSVNFSYEQNHTVNTGDTVPPNLATLNAMRLLLQERPKLKKLSEKYDEVLNTDPEMDSLRERMNLVKANPHYSLLQERFNTLFMWPGFLSTLSKKKRGDTVKNNAGKKENTKRKCLRRYPMTTSRRNIRINSLQRQKKVIPKIEASTDCTEQSSGDIAIQTDDYAMQIGHNAMKTEISQSGTSDKATSTATKSETVDDTQLNVPQQKRLGRPLGSKTKRKARDPCPVRTSQRHRGKVSECSSNESSELLMEETTTTTGKRKRAAKAATDWDCAVYQDSSSMYLFASSTAPSTPVLSQTQTTTMDGQELLSKLSPSLVQQVISQEVQVKPIGTYMNVTPP